MQKDYIMRIVEQFVQAIAAIVRRRKARDYKEARELVRTTGLSLLRLDIDLLLLYHPDQMLDHFKDISNRIESERCVFSADLLSELALIEEEQQRPEAALRLKILSLHLYTVGIPLEKQFQTPEYYEKVSKLAEELKDQPLSPKILESLRSYQTFQLVGRDNF